MCIVAVCFLSLHPLPLVPRGSAAHGADDDMIRVGVRSTNTDHPVDPALIPQYETVLADIRGNNVKHQIREGDSPQ
jgi:hypothetical protein